MRTEDSQSDMNKKKITLSAWRNFFLVIVPLLVGSIMEKVARMLSSLKTRGSRESASEITAPASSSATPFPDEDDDADVRALPLKSYSDG